MVYNPNSRNMDSHVLGVPKQQDFSHAGDLMDVDNEENTSNVQSALVIEEKGGNKKVRKIKKTKRKTSNKNKLTKRKH